MSYLVLARKWRPLNFDDVVGQEHITRTLKKAIESNRVAHAYIFSGTRGVGKTTTARIMARALNCDKGPTTRPCGECPSCKDILSGSSFDVLEIDGASNNRVEDVRELRENVNYSSMGGKYRIYVIDEVHMLTRPAFNALLKTLEEPPKNVIFIFATTEPNKIPETIHSRCQRYDFRRITTEQILNRLVYICDNEKITYERAGLLLVARKADGSMRDALSILDQVFSFCPNGITEKDVRTVLGLADVDVYRSIMDAVAERNAEPILAAIQSILYEGNDLRDFFLGLEEHLRRLLFLRIDGVLENKRIDLQVDTPELAAIYKQQSARFSEGTLVRMIEIVRRAENDLAWSAFPRLLVEITLLKLAFMDSTISVEDLVRAFHEGGSEPVKLSHPSVSTDSAKKKSDAGPVASAQGADAPDTTTVPPVSPARTAAMQPSGAAAPVSSAAPPVDAASFAADSAPGAAADLRKLWPAFVDAIMHDRPTLGSYLSMAYVTGAVENSLDIRFAYSYRFQFGEVTRKENRDEIEQRLDAAAGRRVELHITIETQKPAAAAKGPARAAAPRSIEEDAAKEPIINTVLEVFDGEVLD